LKTTRPRLDTLQPVAPSQVGLAPPYPRQLWRTVTGLAGSATLSLNGRELCVEKRQARKARLDPPAQAASLSICSCFRWSLRDRAAGRGSARPARDLVRKMRMSTGRGRLEDETPCTATVLSGYESLRHRSIRASESTGSILTRFARLTLVDLSPAPARASLASGSHPFLHCHLAGRRGRDSRSIYWSSSQQHTRTKPRRQPTFPAPAASADPHLDSVHAASRATKEPRRAHGARPSLR